MTDKVWFKIGEAAQQVGATPKELRYWEKVIPDLRPRRSKGNLRYYHIEELARLERIRQWLSEGLTVSDCRERLQGAPAVIAQPPPPAEVPRLRAVLAALRALHARLGAPPGVALGEAAEPLPSPGAKEGRAPAGRDAPPAGRPLLEETEAGSAEAPEPSVQAPAPPRIRRPRPDKGALGHMWSGGRLPLDWDE